VLERDAILERLLDSGGPTLAVTQQCLAQYDGAPKDLRGLLGLYLFAASAQLSPRPPTLREPDDYLQDHDVQEVLFSIYEIDRSERNLLPLQFLKAGTTSFILKSNHRHVLKKAPVHLFLKTYEDEVFDLPGEFIQQVHLFKARAYLTILYYLVKLNLGETEQFWTMLLNAEKSLVP